MDETLFDDAYARRRGLRAVHSKEPTLRRHSLDWLFSEYGRLLNAYHRGEVERRVDPDTARRERFRRLGRSCGVSWPDGTIDELVALYRATYVASGRAVPGAHGLLRAVKARAQVGVVTNSRVPEQEAKLAELGLTDLVDFMVVSDGVGVWKPDPRIFEIALSRAHATPSEAVMIGDSWENDIVGANAAGIRAVWFDRYRRPVPREPAPISVVRSFSPPTGALRALGLGR